MGTSNPNHKSTYNLLRGLRGLISIIGVLSTLNLQVQRMPMTATLGPVIKKAQIASKQGAVALSPPPPAA